MESHYEITCSCSLLDPLVLCGLLTVVYFTTPPATEKSKVQVNSFNMCTGVFKSKIRASLPFHHVSNGVLRRAGNKKSRGSATPTCSVIFSIISVRWLKTEIIDCIMKQCVCSFQSQIAFGSEETASIRISPSMI